MIFNGKEVLDMTDQELADASYDLQYLLATRENRLLDARERHKVINFKIINPEFINLEKEINDEIALRKARS